MNGSDPLPALRVCGKIMKMQVRVLSLISVATGNRTPFRTITWLLVLLLIVSCWFHGYYKPNIFTMFQSTSTPSSAACWCAATMQTKWAQVSRGLHVLGGPWTRPWPSCIEFESPLCGVFKGWISVAHCPFQRKWRFLHIWYISVLVGTLLLGSPTWGRFSFCSSGSSVVFLWCDAPLVRSLM